MKYLLLIFAFLIPTAYAAVKTNVIRAPEIKSYIEEKLKLPVESDITVLDITPVKTLRGKSLTQKEYNDTKRDLIGKMRNKGYEKLDNDEQVYAWLEILNNECAGKTLPANFTIESLNNLLEKGC